MNNFYTYTLELRDRMTSALGKAGGSLVATTRRVSELRKEVKTLEDTPFGGFAAKVKKSFNDLPGASYLRNPLVQMGVVAARSFQLGMAQEMRTASLEVMFGGEAKAKQMIDNISAYAKQSPYGKEGLTDAVQMMAGFGIAQDKIMPNLRAIGDIAMGNKPKFDSLTLAFSQMSSVGQLMGQDLMQMTNAGFNPLYYMSEQTGRSLVDLRNDMSKGLITSQMVIDTFHQAAAAGGQFHGMAEKMANTFGGQVSLAMSNVNDLLIGLYNIVSPLLVPVIGKFNLLLGNTSLFIDKIVLRFTNMSTGARILTGVMLTLAATFAVVKTATLTYAGVVKVFTAIKSAETLAWVANAVAMWANPITWVTAVVIALIGGIAYLIIKVDGWSETWGNMVEFCKLAFSDFKESAILDWLRVQDAFQTGLGIIEQGWYKLQSLWDSDAANKGLAKLASQRDARAREIVAQENKVGNLRGKMANMDIIALRPNDTSLSDVVNKMKSKLGIVPPEAPKDMLGGNGTNNMNSIAGGGAGGKNGAGGTAANSIATGGAKTTHITLTIGNMIQTMTVSANNIRESAEQVRDIVADELTRALLMVQSNVQ